MPGHYLVRLRLTGDHPLDCTVDVDLVDNNDEIKKRAGEDTYRWAECRQGIPNPVNNPGALPFLIGPPSVTLIGSAVAVDITLTTRADEEVQGWFILAPPDDPQPWHDAAYQSLVQQKLISAGVSTPFEWDAQIGESLAPGIYQLTVWFHRRGQAGWEHAAGGDIALAPIVVDDDRTVRWAGPVRATLARSPQTLVAEQTSPLELTLTGPSNRMHCTTRWSLFADQELVTSGNAGPCRAPDILLPPATAAGRYRLQIDVLTDGDDGPRLNDAVSMPVTVVGGARDGAPR
jgi:hypothetical protein